MPYPIFDRSRLTTRPLNERVNETDVSVMIDPSSQPPDISEEHKGTIGMLADRIIEAKKNGSAVIIAYGAHCFRNGNSPALIRMMQDGFITQLGTNGAGSIHDWEMSYQGATCESVERYVKEGQFGLWTETGRYINLAVLAGAAQGKGYGESLGEFIETGKFFMPNRVVLERKLGELGELGDLLNTEGVLGREVRLDYQHPEFSLLAAAFRYRIPLSVGVGIGNDITHTSQYCDFAAIGKASGRDFLTFTHSKEKLEGEVFICIGSAVMGPMIYEKAHSMARNLALQQGAAPDNNLIVVCDIQPMTHNWQNGEPGKTQSDYYLRYHKTFSRMGGQFEYLQMDNRAFVQNLYHAIEERMRRDL